MPKKSRKVPNREDLKDKLILATAHHAGELGWGEEALLAGAKTIKVEESRALSLFPGGAGELVEGFIAWGDRAMLKALPNKLDKLRVRERIALAVRTRLELLEPYKAAVSKSLAIEARPWRAPGALKSLYATVDAMWRAAGDTSTDFNFYTKRMLLAGVYTSTLLFWLNDKSDDSEGTWDFLDHRIENVMQFGKLTSKLKERVSEKAGKVREMAEKARTRRKAA